MPSSPLYQGASRLSHLGVIRARGADAAAFLQGQLTNDVVGLDAGHARLAGFCSAKGRLQASFTVLRPAADEFLLICAADLLPATLKRLSMFVLRAKCKLDDASAELPLVGIVGPTAVAGTWQTGTAPDGCLAVRLPDSAGHVRCIVVGANDAANVAPTDAPTLPLDTWRWLELCAGIPLIEAATVDRFVPQMLNYELVGGVDFKKGCYPGQEVVARSQYRGTLKRRMFLFDVDAPAAAGNEIFAPNDPGQPAGLVVNAAPNPHEGSTLLAEAKLAAVEPSAREQALHLGSADGPVLRLRELPYPVPREAVEVP